MNSAQNHLLVSSVFKAKKAPLALLSLIGNYREFHRKGFQMVKDTVKPGVVLEGFDCYFDFVLKLADTLKPLWNV